MRVLDLFSGIGGFSLGLERAGFRTVAFCEIDPYARRVLARHWPGVPCYDDVRAISAARLAADGIAVDVVCGGFPCQDISTAGRGVGLGGERSGLWFEMLRVIAGTRPAWVIAENVSVLRSRGLDTVLRGLDEIGYDAEWHCIPASAVGAPHRRDRVWIVAHPASRIRRQITASLGSGEGSEGQEAQSERLCQGLRCSWDDGPPASGSLVANANGTGRAQPIRAGQAILRTGPCELAGPAGSERNPWVTEPDVGRVADGVPSRVDRLRCLGNAVVPQIPQMLGEAILKAEAMAA